MIAKIPLLIMCRTCGQPRRFIPQGTPVYKNTRWGMCTAHLPCCPACRRLEHCEHTVVVSRTPGWYAMTEKQYSAITRILNEGEVNEPTAVQRILPAFAFVRHYVLGTQLVINFDEADITPITKPNQPQFATPFRRPRD
jgi:hypothetical protein